MPELPEVELVARSLDSLIRNRTISSAELLRERLAPHTSPAQFDDHLAGATIVSVGRRGKHVLLHLNNKLTLIVHLRMSGRFSVIGADRDLPKYTHAIFYLADGERLIFDDQRHFGFMKVVRTDDLFAAKELAKLAPEPLSDDFSVEYFRSTLKISKLSLKEFLLDQTKVCGLGNIYACEAMFDAGVHPVVTANKLSKPRVSRLHLSIIDTLNNAILHAQGRAVTSADSEGRYFNGSSNAGWSVYGREAEPCFNCKTPIVRLKQGGRSTYYCRRCQRK